MKLQDIFAKDIDRQIDGVIKADDDSHLISEVEEYVLTDELKKHLDLFLDAYNNSKVSNGVWISGFYGSGKSHLLKMLSLFLGHREIQGKSLLDIFTDKCRADEAMLKAELKKAYQIPSQSILFNIDQKSDVINKKEVDALLAVFVKVFNETCGYYGKNPYVAQFERDLDEEGHLEQFKQEFKNITKQNWDPWGRARAVRVAADVDQAYNKVSNREVSNILDKYRSDYALSIEDFAEQVNNYIESQGKDFRLNFFVDEVGQYIDRNTKLMTNLQTIAESLITKTKGKSWIIVTAQEDTSSIVGERSAKEDYDVSKIQARFPVALKLASSDVAEVIQKRLLAKKPQVKESLTAIYNKNLNSFKTLFDFADGSREYPNYQDLEHFIDCYPFIPYQFRLFQSAIESLSDHNAFEGKHKSVGERSLITVFQNVAKRLKDHELGELATFDLMYDGIESALKSNLTRAVRKAQEEIDNKLAIKILKALCIVKYVQEFKATVRNICILMHNSFDDKLPTSLKKSVEEALNKLEQQTFIQRNGDTYEYLTNDEKDTEEDIKKTEIESSAILDELNQIIPRVLKNNKIRYENIHDYPYARKLDGKLFTRDSELSVNIITPFNENISNETALAAHNASQELMVIMPADKKFVDDLSSYLKAEKFINQNYSSTQKETVKSILDNKRFQNKNKYKSVELRVKELLAEAKLYIKGTEKEIGGEDPQARIEKAFYQLIESSYPNLGMIQGEAYREDDIGKLLTIKGGMQENLSGSLQEAEQEILNRINSQHNNGIRVSVKDLLEHFQIKPYGWYPSAILCTIAKLVTYNKVEISQDSNVLEPEELGKKLNNSQAQAQLIIKPQQEYSQAKIRRLKDFYQSFFDEPIELSEPKALAKRIEQRLADSKKILDAYLAEAHHISPVAALEGPKKQIESCLGKSYNWYLDEFLGEVDELLEAKESIIDPIDKFMSGSQREIYEASSDFIRANEANFSILDSTSIKQAQEILADPLCHKNNKMQELKTLIDALRQELEDKLNKAKDKLGLELAEMKSKLENLDEFAGYIKNNEAEFARIFTDFSSELRSQKLYAVLNDKFRSFQDKQYKALLLKISESPKPLSSAGASSNLAVATEAGAELSTKLVSLKELKLDFNKPLLSSEGDIENYCKASKEAMLKEIKQGNKIQL